MPKKPIKRVLTKEDILRAADCDDSSADWRKWSLKKCEAERKRIPELDAWLSKSEEPLRANILPHLDEAMEERANRAMEERANRAIQSVPSLAETMKEAYLEAAAEHEQRKAADQSKALPAPAVEAGSQGDKPDESGYVESPADPTAYAPASDIVSKRTPDDLMITMRELRTILKDYGTNRVRWTRPLGKNGQPMRNRRSVHLGDWTAYVERRMPDEADGFPRLPEAELEHRKVAVRDARHAGK